MIGRRLRRTKAGSEDYPVGVQASVSLGDLETHFR